MVLTVLCDDPEALAVWLPPALGTQVRLRRPDQLQEIVVPDDGSDLTGLPESPPADGTAVSHVLRLRLDGPEGVLPLVAQYLHGQLGAVAAVTAIVVAGAAAPSPVDVLAALAAAGLAPGVDLAACRWAGPNGVWVTGPGGAAVVAVQWRRRYASRDLARLVLVTLPLTPGSPLEQWLHRVAAEAQSVGRDDWMLPLQALYLDAVLTTVSESRGPGGRSRWPFAPRPAIIGTCGG